MTMTVQLPKIRMTPGLCVSTTEVMDKLRKKAKPHGFKSLTVSSHTVDFIRFEAEFESKIAMDLVMSKLNRILLKVSGFEEGLKVKCAPLKLGPLKHEWEAYFRDDPKMDEKKPGYRPDTIHIKNLPLKWFGGSKPSTGLLIDAFKVFGDIKRFHIPLLDEMEVQSQSSFKKFTHSESMLFEAFLMYRDYVGFVKAMEGLRGVKLVKRTLNEDLEYDIIVDFDKTKHLSDKAIKKRRLDREYGIKNTDEMKKLKEDTKKQREAYQQRIQELMQRKNQARCLLELLLKKVSEKEEESSKKRKEESEKRRQIEEEQRKKEEEDERRQAEKDRQRREEAERESCRNPDPPVINIKKEVSEESQLKHPLTAPKRERILPPSTVKSSSPTPSSTSEKSVVSELSSKPKVVSLRSIVQAKVEPQRDPEEYRQDYRSYFEEFKKTTRKDEETDDRGSRKTSHDRDLRSLSHRESPEPEEREEATRLHPKYRGDTRHPVREEYYPKKSGTKPRQDPYPENYRQDRYHYHRPASHEREVIEESQPPKRQRITFETSTEETTPPPSSSKLSTESRPRLIITTTNDSSEGGPSPSKKRLSLVVKINTDY